MAGIEPTAPDPASVAIAIAVIRKPPASLASTAKGSVHYASNHHNERNGTRRNEVGHEADDKRYQRTKPSQDSLSHFFLQYSVVGCPSEHAVVRVACAERTACRRESYHFPIMGNGIACTIFGIFGENRSRQDGSGDVPGDQTLVRSDVGIVPDASAGTLTVRLQRLARRGPDLASTPRLKAFNQLGGRLRAPTSNWSAKSRRTLPASQPWVRPVDHIRRNGETSRSIAFRDAEAACWPKSISAPVVVQDSSLGRHASVPAVSVKWAEDPAELRGAVRCFWPVLRLSFEYPCLRVQRESHPVRY